MSWDRIEGQWKQRRGKALQQWGTMMDDDLAAVSGKYETLVGNLQEKYGIAKDEARKQVDLFKKTLEQLKKSNIELMKTKDALSKLKANNKPAKPGLSVKKKRKLLATKTKKR